MDDGCYKLIARTVHGDKPTTKRHLYRDSSEESRAECPKIYPHRSIIDSATAALILGDETP